jgi:hypothetical protein
LGTVALLIWLLPTWLTSQDSSGLALSNDVEILKARNSVRTTLLQGLGGVFLLAGAVIAWRQMLEGARQNRHTQETAAKALETSARQLDISRRQLVIEASSRLQEQRSRAITALGDASPAVRVGGVFALEQTMNGQLPGAENADAGRSTEPSFREDGIYLLASLVRTRARLADPSTGRPLAPRHSGVRPERTHDEDLDLRVRAPDVQAALLVIGRRPRLSDEDYATIGTRGEVEHARSGSELDVTTLLMRNGVSLHSAYLNNAALSDFNLTLVRFDDAVLAFSSLRRCDFRCSRFVRADLRRAYLRGADLRWADLEHADLSRSRPIDANFAFARLRRAEFAGATIRGAKFRDAIDVYQAYWEGAEADSRTTWPDQGAPSAVRIVQRR